MNELPSAASAVLEQARAAHDPSERDVARSLSMLHASLTFAPDLAEPALPDTSAVATTTTTTGKTGLGLFGAKAVKLTLVVAALGGAASGVWLSSGGEPRARERSTEVSPAVAPRPGVEVAPSEARSPVAGARASTVEEQAKVPGEQARPAPAAIEAARPARSTTSNEASPRRGDDSSTLATRPQSGAARGRVTRSVAATSAQKSTTASPTVAVAEAVPSSEAQAEPVAPTTSSTSAVAVDAAAVSQAPVQARASSELSLIDRASLRLRDGDASGALGLLDEHLALYPAGVLSTERRGLRVLALCAAGRLEQGRFERDAFLRDAGRTPLAVRVRRACVDGVAR